MIFIYIRFIGGYNGFDFSNWSKGDFANKGREDANRISRIIKTLFIYIKRMEGILRIKLGFSSCYCEIFLNCLDKLFF